MQPLSGLNRAAQETLDVWHRLVDSKDAAALSAITADDVVFRSPTVFRPFHGKPAFMLVIATVANIFEDFRYGRRFASADGANAVLEFEARIGDKSLKGVDMIRFDPRGLITEFEVMIRPANALMALAERMGEAAGPGLAHLRSAQSDQ